MFRMRSRLEIISALLLLTTPCFAFKCRTCTGEECQKKDVEMRECTKFSAMLPSEAYPLFSKFREKWLYACLKLEYHYGTSTRILERCIITEDVDTVCENIAKSIPYTHCAVKPPPSASVANDTVSKNSAQLHAKVILTNDNSNLIHKIRIQVKCYTKNRATPPKPNSDATSELTKPSVNPLATSTTKTGDWEDNTERSIPELVSCTSEENQIIETDSDDTERDLNEVLTPTQDISSEETTANSYPDYITSSGDIDLTPHETGDDDNLVDITYETSSSDEIITPSDYFETVTDSTHTTATTVSKINYTSDSKPNTVSETTTDLTYNTDSASKAFPGNVEKDENYITSTIDFKFTDNIMATEITTTKSDVEMSSESTILTNTDVGHVADNISYETTTLNVLNGTSEFDQRSDENEFYTTAFTDLETTSDSDYTTTTSSLISVSNVADEIVSDGEFENSSAVESDFVSTTDKFSNKTVGNNDVISTNDHSTITAPQDVAVSDELRCEISEEQGAEHTELSDHKDHPCSPDDFSENSTENDSSTNFSPNYNENENSYSSPPPTISEYPNDNESFTSPNELTPDLNDSERSSSGKHTTMSDLGNINIDAETPKSGSATVVPPSELDIEKIGADITKPSEVTDPSRELSNENESGLAPDLNDGDNSTSSARTTISNSGATSIIIIEAENPSSVSSTVTSHSELNFGPTNPTATEPTVEIASTDKANQTESSEEYGSSLDEVIDASLGYKVEFSFILCMTSFIIYLVL